MRQFTEEERKKLLLAGKMCWEDLLLDLELQPESPEEAQALAEAEKRLCQAENEAWARLGRQKKRARRRRWAMLAACLLLACGAVLLSGTPSVAYQKLWNHLFFKDNGGTSMSISSSATVLLPENWSGCYLPTEIPRDFKIENAEATKFSQSIFYTNENGNYIDFYVALSDYSVHLDTEDCTLEEIQVNGCDGMLRTKYKNGEMAYISISWIENGVFFDLSADSQSVEALQSLAESVMIAE